MGRREAAPAAAIPTRRGPREVGRGCRPGGAARAGGCTRRQPASVSAGGRKKVAMDERRCETDVAIIGGGAAGIAAALEAGTAGARVALLEQDGALGGTAATSGGGCFLVG